MTRPRARVLVVAVVVLASLPAFAADEDRHRAAVTLKRMDALAQAIAASIANHHETPDAISPALANLPLDDAWGTPLRYVKTGDSAFQIISAGADKKFDEKTWSVDAHTTDYTADAVYVKAGPNRAGIFRRSWVDSLGFPLGLSSEETKSESEALAQSQLDKVKNMTGDEAWSYIRASGTTRAMLALSILIERYRLKNGLYPRAASMGELAQILLPESAADVDTKDWWSTEFRYEVSSDGKTYRLVSAGNDRKFDPTSWDQRGPLATTDDDAVVRNGEFIRRWDEHTRRGLTAEERRRATLRPQARTLLERAEALDKKEDAAGALDAYVEAVKADPAAADLALIQRYAGSSYASSMTLAPPPPPPPPGTKPVETPAVSDVQKHEAVALRQYLQLHPGDWEATKQLAWLVPLADAESLLDPFFRTRPADPDVHVQRAVVRARHRHFKESLDDYDKAQRMDPINPELFYVAGVTAYEAVAKGSSATADQKRALIRRGLTSLQKAESMKPDYFEAMAYHNLLLRQQALLESDPAERKKLVAEADAIRERAISIIRRRKSGSTQPASTSTTAAPPTPTEPLATEPLRVGGDVRAPVVIHRVEAEYPEEARKHAISGVVIVEVVIDKEGYVRQATAIKPLPYGASEAALAAVKQWRFRPATRNGEPVDSLFNLTVHVGPP